MFLQAISLKDASFSVMLPILTWYIAGLLTVVCGPVKAARQLDVDTPQQFMDAVRSLRNNEELFLQIQAPYLQLSDDLLLTNVSDPITNGDLKIIGKKCTTEDCTYPLTVLDLGGLSSCTTLIGGVARIVLKNLLITGTCFKFTLFHQTYGLSYYSASGMYFFTVDRSPGVALVQRFQETNVIWHTSYHELGVYTAGPIIAELQLPELEPQKTTWFTVANAQPVMRALGARQTHYEYLSSPGTVMQNITITASVPSLPLAPHMCDGPNRAGEPIPLSDMTMNSSVMAFWAAGNKTELHVALSVMQDVIAQNKLPRQNPAWALVLALAENMTLAVSDAPGGQPYQMPGVVMASGPLNHVPQAARSVALDLAGSTQPVWHMGENPHSTSVRGKLILHKLHLQGLGSAPLGALMPNSTGGSDGGADYMSALPFWAFSSSARPQLLDALTLNATNSTNTSSPWFLYLSNVTLQLPQSDYAALLSAAMRGSAWKTGAVNTAPLLRGISHLVPAANQQQVLHLYTSSLLLDAYEGYGVSAVQLRVRPDSPLPCQDLPQWDLSMSTMAGLHLVECDPPMAPATDNTSSSIGLSQGAKLGIGLGVGLGGAAALVAAAALLLWGPVRSNKGHPPGSSSDGHVPGIVGGCKGERPGPEEEGGCADHGEVEICLTVNAPSTVGSGKTSRTTPTIEELASATRRGATLLEDAVVASMAEGGPRDTQLSRLAALIASSSSDPSTSSARGARYVDAVAEQARTLGAGFDEDKLTLEGVLGRGMWGTVFYGSWKNLPVAVKTFLFAGDGARGVVAYDRAVTEAALCCSLNHRNIVQTYRTEVKEAQETDLEGGLLHVFVDREQGGTAQTKVYKLFLIQERCSTSVRMAWRAGMFTDPTTGQPYILSLLVLLLDVATGVEHLHARNVVHGDLKPDNVLLTKDPTCPAGFVAKLTDFGLSATLDPGCTHVSNYKSGTPFYVAPEVLDHACLTKASDIYSLVMWELYTGQAPFKVTPDGGWADNPQFLELPIVRDPPVMKLVARCIREEPHTRPTATQVREDLLSILSSKGANMADKLDLQPDKPPAA